MSAFNEAWSMLKALPGQQMLHPAGRKFDTSMPPAIQGMLARRGIDPRDLRQFHLARIGGSPEGFDLPHDHPDRPGNFRAADVSLARQAERERRAEGDIDPNQRMRGSLFDDDNPDPIVPLYPSAFPNPAEGYQFGEKEGYEYEEGY